MKQKSGGKTAKKEKARSNKDKYIFKKNTSTKCSHLCHLSLVTTSQNIYLFIFKDFIYVYLERGEGREKDRERNIDVWLSLVCPDYGDLACNPGMCPDWELNQQPFSSQAVTQSAEPHQPGLTPQNI